MGIVVGILGLIFSLGAVAGFYVDTLVRDLVRGQLSGADRLEVRVEAVPNYKLVSGEIDRLRLAGRGLAIRPEFRIARLDLETDAIAVDLGSTSGPRLRRPLQAAVHIELVEDDLNQALNAPDILKSLQGIRTELPGGVGGAGREEVLDFTEPRIFLKDGEVILQSVVRVRGREETLLVAFRTDLVVDAGTRLRFIKPAFTLNDVPVPPEIADVFLAGLNDIVDLEQLAPQGITARVLNFKVEPGKLDVVVFARIERIPGN